MGTDDGDEQFSQRAFFPHVVSSASWTKHCRRILTTVLGQRKQVTITTTTSIMSMTMIIIDITITTITNPLSSPSTSPLSSPVLASTLCITCRHRQMRFTIECWENSLPSKLLQIYMETKSYVKLCSLHPISQSLSPPSPSCHHHWLPSHDHRSTDILQPNEFFPRKSFVARNGRNER